jgi:CRP/FNR family transcriptional regulator, cyclic AMP receptor protein
MAHEAERFTQRLEKTLTCEAWVKASFNATTVLSKDRWRIQKRMPVSRTLPSGFPGSFFADTSQCITRSFQRGETIYAIGEECRSIYFVHTGLVKMTMLSEEGKEAILSMRKGNDIFGEFGLCRSQRLVSAVAIEPSEITEVRIEDLRHELLRSQDAAYKFLLWTIEKLSEAYETIGEVSLDNLHRRLAKTLIRLAQKYGDDVEAGTQLSCFLTQEEIAQMVSATREAVSSSLKELSREGFISYTRRGKLIVHRQKLINELKGWTTTDTDCEFSWAFLFPILCLL